MSIGIDLGDHLRSSFSGLATTKAAAALYESLAIIHHFFPLEQGISEKFILLRGFNIPFTKFTVQTYILFYRSMTTLPKEPGLNHEPFYSFDTQAGCPVHLRGFHLAPDAGKWSNQRYATIPVLKRNGEYVGSITEGDILWGMKTCTAWIWKPVRTPISSFPPPRLQSRDGHDRYADAVKGGHRPELCAVVDDRNNRHGAPYRVLLRGCTTNIRPCRQISASRAAHPPM